jgi:hypothetical protein
MALVITIVVVLLVLVAAAAYVVRRNPELRARIPWGRDDGRRLRSRYGREYDRLYTAHNDHAAVAREIDRRERKRQELKIAEIDGQERDRLVFDWSAAQAAFVDDPGGATRRTEQLVGEALTARGYPTGDGEEQLALASVDHAHTLGEFRDGHALLQQSQTGAPDVDATEQLRQAMLHFRVFFDDVVGMSAKSASNSKSAKDAKPVLRTQKEKMPA